MTEQAGPAPATAPTSAPRGLTGPALTYFVIVAGAASLAAVPGLQTLSRGGVSGWGAFVILATAAAVAQLFVVITPRDQSYHTTIVFLTAAVLLLPPALLPLVAVAQHLPEWVRARYPWYIQTFNIANYTVDLLAAAAAARVVLAADGLVSDDGTRFALAGAAAAIVLVIANHVVLAGMLRLARGHSIRQTGLFTLESLSTDLVLGLLGVVVASTWRLEPTLIPLAVAPLVLIHRSLSVPELQEQVRLDTKTGLFNARHFAAVLEEEVARARRFERPLALLMADLDLLRDVNNTYGHLAGDAVLHGVADVFRREVRDCDLPARFGGEEFAVLLPETTAEEAHAVAERIRAAVAAERFQVPTASEPVCVTVSIGVAAMPRDAKDPEGLAHQADVAVYRAKMQGRNRVVEASDEPLAMPMKVAQPSHAHPVDSLVQRAQVREIPAPAPLDLPATPSRSARPVRAGSTRIVSTIVGGIGVGGIAAGALWLWLGLPLEDWIGLAAIAVLVGLGQALALDVDEGSISAAAVGALAGAAVFGPRAALAVAAAAALVDLAARRSTPRHAIFNTGALTFASLAASGVFALHVGGPVSAAVSGLAGGAVYFAVNVGLLSLVVAADDHERPLDVWRNRFAWLLPHYIAYGFIASVMALAYETAHIYALIVFALPLLLIRTTQGSYVKHTRKSTEQLRGAAEKISEQNQSLERANELLKEWSTAAMESLSATVDARDAYTAGHSRRVRLLALEIGEELGLSKPELELLGYAALFHDIGKLAVPDSILQKAGPLTEAELEIVKLHAGEGAKIVSRLGFLNDAVPAILHHHERFDGTGYPDGLSGSDIPYGARIIHVADALDSIMTARTYRPARSLDAALGELRGGSGRQFCPRCVDALLRIVERDGDGSIAALLEEESAGAIGSVRLTVIDGGKDPEAGRGRGGLEPPAPPVHASL